HRRPFTLAFAAVLLAVPLAIAPLSLTAPVPQHSTWNYDGGLLIITDGAIGTAPCFRLSGRVTAPSFFDNLRREDSKSGTIFHRGHEIVTEFPDKLHVSFVLYDTPCDYSLKQAGTRVFLTRAMVSTLRLSFYWKRGLKLRPASDVVAGHFETHRILPDRVDPAVADLPEMFEWYFEFDVPSEGVPVTDSLVVVLHQPGGKIAARAAARM
ncbi:MAG TPA: hypothetical protein VMT75_11405, partial [Candidatus Saccharimonadales bacterium]|nr:hypothetical protein [Candidatus Saccharimonadales bacterium]